MRSLFAVCLILLGISAAASGATPEAMPANQLYRAAGGVAVMIDENGRLQLYAGQVVPLDDGRTLIRGNDKKWHLDPAETSEVKKSSLIDLAIYGDQEGYLGKRVRVTGRLYSAGVKSVEIALPGDAYLNVDLSSVPRDLIKRLIEECGSISTPPGCEAQIVGDIAPSSRRGSIDLVDAQVILPTYSAR